ncbi:MAG: hypothetical protein ACRDEA_11115, partial [Microcystaceae cyanobacterium]
MVLIDGTPFNDNLVGTLEDDTINSYAGVDTLDGAAGIELENSSCGLCGSESYKILYAAPENSLYSECCIVQCSNCGLARTNPRPTKASLMKVYTNEYYSRKEPILKGWGNRYKIFAMKHSLYYLYPYVIPFQIPKNAAICDVGCGAGQWLTLMKAAHPNAKLYGFEIDSETAFTAQKFCGGEIHYGDFLNNGWPSN